MSLFGSLSLLKFSSQTPPYLLKSLHKNFDYCERFLHYSDYVLTDLCLTELADLSLYFDVQCFEFLFKTIAIVVRYSPLFEIKSPYQTLSNAREYILQIKLAPMKLFFQRTFCEI